MTSADRCGIIDCCVVKGNIGEDMTSKQRIHCSNEKFLEAVYSSKTYAEIASKTNQKLSSTMARYSKTKKALLSRGIKLPEMERKKSTRNLEDIDSMVEIVKRLKSHHSES